MKKNLLFLLLAAATVITSCSKDDDDNNSGGGGTPVSNTTKLCNKNWKMTSFKFNGVEFISQLDACDVDDFIRFNTDNTYLEDEGPTKCDPADPQTLTGTWNWVANETKLVGSGDGLANDTLNVLTNSGTVLKLGYNDQTLGLDIEITYGL